METFLAFILIGAAWRHYAVRGRKSTKNSYQESQSCSFSFVLQISRDELLKKTEAFLRQFDENDWISFEIYINFNQSTRLVELQWIISLCSMEISIMLANQVNEIFIIAHSSRTTNEARNFTKLTDSYCENNWHKINPIQSNPHVGSTNVCTEIQFNSFPFSSLMAKAIRIQIFSSFLEGKHNSLSHFISQTFAT